MKGVVRAWRAVVVAALLGLVACPTVASADDGARVDALYEEAKKDLTEGRYPFALEKFRRGIELAGRDRKRVWRMMLGIALSYDEMRQQEYSIQYYRRFLDDVRAHPDQVDAKWDKRRKVVEVQVVQLEAQLLGSRGVVTFNTDPPGARVTVDGVALGSEGKAETPLVAYLRAGEHEIRLVREGSVPAKMRLVVEQGRRRTVNVPLESTVKKGTLRVHGGHPEASVRIDGREAGRGHEVIVALTAGWHELVVQRPEQDDFTQRVEVSPAQEAVVRVPLPGAAAVAPGASLQAAGEGARLAPLWGWIGAGTAGALVAGGWPSP